MSESTIPAPFVTNDTYSTGLDVGTPTRVDPVSNANGFVRGVVAAPQHINHFMRPLVRAARRHFAMSALKLRELRLEGETIDDTSDGIAAISRNTHFETVVVKANTNGVLLCTDAERYGLGGTVADITTDVVTGRIFGTKILVIGDGTNNNAFSTTNGSTWTAGGSTGLLGVPVDLCESDIGGSLAAVVCTSSGGSAYSSGASIGVTWTNPTVGNDISDVVTGGGVTSLAQVSGATLVAVGLQGGDPAFARSTDGGVTWDAASGTVPNAASHGDAGSVAGDGGGEVWHAGHRNVNTIDFASSADGNSWTTRATLTSKGTVSAVRLLRCPNSGLLVLLAQINTGAIEARASLDGGRTWTEAVEHGGFALTAYAVANGKLYATKDDMLFASDGVGED